MRGGYSLLAAGYSLLAAGYSLLAAGYSLLAASYSLLAAGYSLLAAGLTVLRNRSEMRDGSYELEVTERSARLIRLPFYRSVRGAMGLGVALVACGLCSWLAYASLQQATTVEFVVFASVAMLGAATLLFGVLVTAEVFADGASRTVYQRWLLVGREVYNRRMDVSKNALIYLWARGANLFEATLKDGRTERAIVIYGELTLVREVAQQFARVLELGPPDDRVRGS